MVIKFGFCGNLPKEDMKKLAKVFIGNNEGKYWIYKETKDKWIFIEGFLKND
jgi:phosphorylcholine metabolism protein LicD